MNLIRCLAARNKFTVKISVEKITAQSFRKYGWLIEYPKKHLKGNKKNLWRIVHKEPKTYGWRIAYLVVRDKTIRRLEQHLHSFESFEPICGRSLLYVAQKQDLKSIKCFKLDRPIILKKKVWHGIVTTVKESEIKLTENAFVKCVYWKLGFKLPKEKKNKS